jgi:hypothetical protein
LGNNFIKYPLFSPSQWWAGVDRTIHDDEALRLIRLQELEELARRNLIGRDWTIFEQTTLARLHNPKGSNPTNAEVAARHGITPARLKKIRTRIHHTLAAARRKRDAALETIDIMANFATMRQSGGVSFQSDGLYQDAYEIRPSVTYSTSINSAATAVSSSNTTFKHYNSENNDND